jgi:hypothetical protein
MDAGRMTPVSLAAVLRVQRTVHSALVMSVVLYGMIGYLFACQPPAVPF